MEVFIYKIDVDQAISVYQQNGQKVVIDPSLINGTLYIDAPDEDTAEKIRLMLTDIRMWTKV
jgi:hypothetical protein